MDDNRGPQLPQHRQQRPPPHNLCHQLLLRAAEDRQQRGHRARILFNNWQISGITQILSGTRQGFSYSYTNVPTGALSGTGAINGNASRVDILCDPNLPRGDRTFTRQFRTECIAPPSDTNPSGQRPATTSYIGPGFS